jgi:hypothetical protein
MPYKSRSQQRAFHAKLKRHEISPKVVQEFDAATRGHFSELPEHAPARGKKPVRRKRG